MKGNSRGGPSPAARFSAVYGQAGTMCMLIGGGTLLAIFCVVRFTSGSPYLVMQRLRMWSCIPPVFLTTLLFMLWYLLIGGAFGLSFGSPCRGREVDKYKGGMLFVLLAALELVFYPCFFVRAELFAAVLLALVCVALCVGVTICYLRVARLPGWIMLLHTIWLVYLLVIALIALFRI